MTTEEKIKQRIEDVALDKSSSPSDWRWIEGYMLDGYKIAMEEYRSQQMTSSCTCNPEEKTGETWCCNLCGRPTARTESKELPGDEEINEYAKIKCDKFYGKGNQDDFSDSILFYNFGMQQMRYIASPLLASRDARIRELEEENKKLLRSIKLF